MEVFGLVVTMIGAATMASGLVKFFDYLEEKTK